MFQSILVPLDGSDFSEQSIAAAEYLAAEYNAALHLVHVHVPPILPGFSAEAASRFDGTSADDWDAEYRRSEVERMDRLARSIHKVPKENLEIRMLEGRVSDAIRDFAQESDVDLIVMASHGRTGLERLWLGSVTEALARQTTKPLLILRPSENGDEPKHPMKFEHILVSLDGSRESEAVLAPVRAFGHIGAKATLLHIVSEEFWSGGEAFPLHPVSMEQIMDRADEYLNSVARRLEGDLEQVSIHVEVAPNLAKSILHVAKGLGVDLLAMSSHGYTGLRRTLLGSVADKVLRATTLPVLLQKPS